MSKKLLICIDVQNDFITGALRNEDAIRTLPTLIEKIKQHEGDIIATHDTHFSKIQVASNWPPAPISYTYEESLEGQKLPVPHCIKLTEGWEIEKNALAAMTDKNATPPKNFFAIDKYTFGWDGWKDYLKAFTFDEIEIVGYCTDICVVSNALILRALFPNMKITVDAACCAGVTPESHKAALLAMKMCQIDVINE